MQGVWLRSSRTYSAQVRVPQFTRVLLLGRSVIGLVGRVDRGLGDIAPSRHSSLR